MLLKTCASCGQSMVMLPTSKGRLMPINRSYFYDRDTQDLMLSKAPQYDHMIHHAFVHWQNCPNADKHRRGKR